MASYVNKSRQRRSQRSMLLADARRQYHRQHQTRECFCRRRLCFGRSHRENAFAMTPIVLLSAVMVMSREMVYQAARGAMVNPGWVSGSGLLLGGLNGLSITL